MSSTAVMRLLSRRSVAGARFVAGMRVSGISHMSTFTRSAVLRQTGAGVMRSAWASQAARAFSGSAARLGSGTSDILLSQKLAEELKYEQEGAAEVANTSPDFLKSFLEQGVWSIDDARGNDEVTLTRKFGDENIRIMFSIADIQTEEDLDIEGESEEAVPPPLPIRASLSITKNSGPGALNVDMVCQDNAFVIENISFYDDAQLGTDLTAEADWKRRGLYIGPQFETLDMTVQDEFEKYLSERGINDSLAGFIPEYAGWKEQQEYVRWLNKVKNFVDL